MEVDTNIYEAVLQTPEKSGKEYRETGSVKKEGEERKKLQAN